MNNEYRLFGSPGAGKTTALMQHIAKGIADYGSANVFVTTFTKAATEEVKQRLQKAHMECSNVRTLHAHGYRSLSEIPMQIAEKKIKEFNAQYSELAVTSSSQDIDDMIEGEFKSEGDRLLNEYNTYRQKMIPRELWPEQLITFAALWDDFKKQTDSIDFTDMIELAYLHVDTAPDNPSAGYFDEVQDFTKLELSLVRKWGSRMDKYILAGDDDQCIYAFKGATADSFLTPELPSDRMRILPNTYRLPKKILKYSLNWIEQVEYRQRKDVQARDEQGHVIYANDYRFRDSNSWLIDSLEQHPDKSIMVLTSCAYMLEPIKKTLRENGIPFGNIYRQAKGDWNPLLRSDKRTMPVDRIRAYMRLHEKGYWTAEDVRRFAEILPSKGVFKRGAKTRIAETFKSVHHPYDVSELLQLFEENALSQMWDDTQGYFIQSIIESKRQSTYAYILSILRKYGNDGLVEIPRITIGTIHSVKGAEADIVYVFPDVSMAGYESMSRFREAYDATVRQFYVGITRARETLYLCGASSQMAVGWV